MVLKSRLKALKDYLSVPTEDRYFDDYCEGADDTLPPGLFETIERKFRFYFTHYPNLQSPSKFLLDLGLGVVKTKYSYRSFKISYNSIQEKLFDRLYGSVSNPDRKWLQQNDEFILQLPMRLQFAIVAMTNKSQQHIQAYIKNEDLSPFCDRVRRWNTNVYGYLPIFFPLYQKYIPTETNAAKAYTKIVQVICHRLTDQEIIECIIQIVKDIRYLFSICPKTTSKMTLWRGVRSTPLVNTLGFVSMSFNPFHVLNYTDGKQCCLQKITILPNTPLLFIGGLSSFKNELECVLPNHSQFYKVRQSMEIIPVVKKTRSKCPAPNETRRVLVQHIVAL